MTEQPQDQHGGWVPAFPGQRPPFAGSNTLSLRHGAFSDRKVLPIVDRLTAGIRDLAAAQPDFAYLAQPAYQPAVDAWARAEARVALLTRFLEDPPADAEDNDGDGIDRIAAAMSALTKWEGMAAKARERLGLDPLSRAKLGKDVATTQQASIATLMAELSRRDQADKGSADHTTNTHEGTNQ